MRLLPRSLAGQAVLLLVVGLIGSHMVSMLMYADDRVAVLAEVGGKHLADRVTDIVRLFDEAPAEWRPRLLMATDSPSLGVALGERPAAGSAANDDWTGEVVRRLLAHSLGQAPERVLVRPLEPANSGTNPEPSAGWRSMGHMMEGFRPAAALRVSVRLDDGTWLNFTAALPPPEPMWSSRALLSMLVMALGVVVLSALAARRLIRPLQQFAEAADRLGKDVAAPPIPETGPLEIRQAAAAFNRMQERLRRLVENRTRLLAAISHDLRTPITLLKLRADFIEDENERARTMATLDEMEAMIASTLAFARDEATAEGSQRVDLAALVSSLCDDLADAGQPVSCEVPDRMPLACRPIALKRALLNLVENAVRYGGCARVRLADRGTAAELTIADDGPGIPEDQLGNVFQPFFRLDAARGSDTGGVGLGLATAQAIIHAHGGDIRLANRPEGGLTVTIELPR